MVRLEGRGWDIFTFLVYPTTPVSQNLHPSFTLLGKALIRILLHAQLLITAFAQQFNLFGIKYMECCTGWRRFYPKAIEPLQQVDFPLNSPNLSPDGSDRKRRERLRG